VAGLALAGVPPLAGFFSKDAILAAAFESGYAVVLGPLALIGTLLTGLYVGRALGLLLGPSRTSGSADRERTGGLGWMYAGLTGLAAAAAVLGAAKAPISALLGAELPESLIVAAVGLLLAVVGISAGWIVSADRLLGPLREPAARGFCVAGGFDGLFARPALVVASAVDRADAGLHRGVVAVGGAALALAEVSRLTDEGGIDRVIGGLVRGARSLGAQARGLQSGLVHRELALATIGGALILAVLAAGAVLGLGVSGG
jgi:NADH-quinone oxidoreductase subunit L